MVRQKHKIEKILTTRMNYFLRIGATDTLTSNFQFSEEIKMTRLVTSTTLTARRIRSWKRWNAVILYASGSQPGRKSSPGRNFM